MTTPAETPLPEPRCDEELLEVGPPHHIETWLRLPPGASTRAALFAAAAWLPLLVLSAVQTVFLKEDALRSFASDFAVHARCLVTLPLFVLAETFVAPRLGSIAQRFLDAGLVTGDDRARFHATVASTRRLRDSLGVELVVLALAYALIAELAFSVPSAKVPGWQLAAGGELPGYSPAGWWHLLVSLPLLLVLFLGWLWRLVLWTRFLRQMSRLDLHLVPAHPDRAAGLKFVARSLRVSSILGLALGAVVAGRVANGVVHEGRPLQTYGPLVLGLVVVVVVLFSGPLLAFTGTLIKERRRGASAYGTLAGEIGQQFEHKWFPRLGRIEGDVLEAPDFSATTDLYSIVANAYQMRLVPLDLKSLIPLVAATLLPLVPVLLITVPLSTLLSHLAKLLL